MSGSLTSSERDAVLADLGQLLEAVGLGYHARPESPHEVFQMALAEVRRIGAVATEAERERIRQLAISVDAFYDAPCPDGVADCVHQDTPFADLI